MMTRYRKTATVEAVQWTGNNIAECRDFLGEDFGGATPNGVIHVHSLEGTVHGSVGYWLMRGTAGEHYLCDPDIFAATYEQVDE